MDVPIPCPCGGRHPGGDTVVLRDRLDFRSATTIRKAIALAHENGITDPAEILALMTEWYCLLGIEAWTVTDSRGKPLPVTRDTIRSVLLENPAAADATDILVDAADGLYMEQVLLPLLARASKSSPPMPMGPSTSAPTAFPVKRPRPSKRSSTTSTRTDGTETTSSLPGGASSTSPRSESAA